MKVFIDHNISPKIARALQELFKDKHIVLCLRDKFPTNISDAEWIGLLSKEGHWIVISGDLRITKNKAERQAFKNSKLHGFFMSPGLFKKDMMVQLARILLQWKKIESIVNATESGATYQITETNIKQL